MDNLPSLDCTIDLLDRYAGRDALCTCLPGQPSTRSKVQAHSQVLSTYRLVIYLNLALVFRDLFGSSNNALALPQECYKRPHVHGLVRAV